MQTTADVRYGIIIIITIIIIYLILLGEQTPSKSPCVRPSAGPRSCVISESAALVTAVSLAAYRSRVGYRPLPARAGTAARDGQHLSNVDVSV